MYIYIYIMTPMLRPHIQEEFERITQNRELCVDVGGGIDLPRFRYIIEEEFILYCERHMGQAVPAISKDDAHLGMILCSLRMLLSSQVPCVCICVYVCTDIQMHTSRLIDR